jgi:hypothetical protein
MWPPRSPRMTSASSGRGNVPHPGRLALTCATTLALALTPALSAHASPALSSHTITLSSLPSGWSSETNSDNGVGCLHNLLEPTGIKQTSVAEVYYVHSGGLPFLDEKLATYSNAQKAFTKIARTIAACHHPSGPFKGYQTTGAVTPLSYAKVANQSIAYQMIFRTSTNLTVDYDYVIARKNKVIVAVLEGGYPSVSSAQFSGFVSLALSKVTS